MHRNTTISRPGKTRLVAWAHLVVAWLIAFAAIHPAYGEETVSARVDRNIIFSGESIQLRITVRGDGAEVDLSPIADFKVHSRGTRSSVQIINGHMLKQVTYDYLLMPLGKGKLIIPALIVDVDGQVQRTDPITITVEDRAAADAANPRRDKEVWVEADVSDSSPFQGQQITYTFRLYNSVQIEDAKFHPPEFKGFTVKEIKDRRSYRKVINGREHMVNELYYALAPLESGAQTIDPAVIEVGIVRQARRGRRTAFDDFFNRHVLEPRIVQGEALNLQVQPLPPLPDGVSFSGLVGRFDLSAEMESTRLNVGDSATLTLTISGEGNIRDAQMPDLQLPPAFKSYADNPEEKVQVNREGYSGSKVFRTALVPVKAGEFILPPVAWVYFDVQQAAYRTLKTQLPSITVTASAAAAEAPVAITPQPLARLKKRVAFTGRDILPPKERLTAIQSHELLGWPIFALAIAGPAMAFGCAVLMQRWRRPDTSPSAVMRARARQALKHAQAEAESGEGFLTALHQALTAAIFAAAGRTGEALTWKEAESTLLDIGIAKEAANQAAELLSKIESLKFSGGASEAIPDRRLLDQTRKMVRELSK